MSLFVKQAFNKIIFNKEEVLQEIFNQFPGEFPDWKIVQTPSLKCDFLCMRNVDIQEEVTMTKNPFSHYKKTIPVTYQKVVNVYVLHPEDSPDDKVDVDPVGENIIISFAHQLFRKLKAF